jgi:hypothetical protein
VGGAPDARMDVSSDAIALDVAADARSDAGACSAGQPRKPVAWGLVPATLRPSVKRGFTARARGENCSFTPCVVRTRVAADYARGHRHCLTRYRRVHDEKDQ